MGAAGWLGRASIVAIVAAALASCNDDPSRDSGGDVDVDADAGDGCDAGDYPPLHCADHELNMTECMLHVADAGDWGTWCGGDCLPICRPPLECPGGYLCHHCGSNYLCLPE
jgi:hypothetical protein